MVCTVNQIQLRTFQSTLPREERLPPLVHSPISTLFQSTLPREERHFWIKHKGYNFYISIHAPTRGATATVRNRFFGYKNFNPRSHERSDSGYPTSYRLSLDFNPRSHERSDSNIAQKICLFLYNTDNKYIIR